MSPSPRQLLLGSVATSALVTALLWLPSACAGRTGPTVLFDAHSAINGRVIVTDEADGVRVMRFEPHGARQTAIRPGRPEQLELAYSRGIIAALAGVPAPRRALVIGLGGGAIPMFLRHHYPKLDVDVVDIDPVVVTAARRFFDFRVDDYTRVHVADGRGFVEQAPGRWDLIVLDAYGRSSIPRHLATRQFLEAVRAHLTPGGVAVANVWEVQHNPLYWRMRATYRAAFPELHVVATGAGSHIFLALSEARGMTHEALLAKARWLASFKHFSFDLPKIVAEGWQLPAGPPNGDVLTD